MKTPRTKDDFPIHTGDIIYLIDIDTLGYNAGRVTAISYRNNGEISIEFLPPHIRAGEHENISFETIKMRGFMHPGQLKKMIDELQNNNDVGRSGSISPPATATGTPLPRWRTGAAYKK